MAGGRGKINEYNKSLTKEELSEHGRKGGLACAKANRERKNMQEMARLLLDLALKSNSEVVEVDEVGSLQELAGKNVTVKLALLLSLTKKAINGDIKAIDMLTTLSGDKVEKQEMNVTNDEPLTQTIVYLPDNGREK